MGLLDKGFILPSVRAASGFVVSNAATKLSETISTTFKTLGSTGPFSKVGANLPSIEKLTASAMIGGNLSSLAGTSELIRSTTAELQGNLLSQGSASQLKNATGAKEVTTDHLVTLSESSSGITVTFEVQPEVTENHTVEYEAVAPPQAPGAFQKYKGTSSPTWVLQAVLISRTSVEATANFYRLCTLRGWTAPFFGEITGRNFPKQLGAPPPVLTLKGLRGLYGPVPVVITSLNITWPRDVDYLPTNVRGEDGNWVPFPALLTVPIGLTVSYSTTQFNQFDLMAYRRGDLQNAFNTPIASQLTVEPPIAESTENYDSRRYPEPSVFNENFDSKRYHLYYGADIRGAVTQKAPDVTLGRQLAQDQKNAREAGLAMLAEASRRAKGGF